MWPWVAWASLCLQGGRIPWRDFPACRASHVHLVHVVRHVAPKIWFPSIVHPQLCSWAEGLGVPPVPRSDPPTPYFLCFDPLRVVKVGCGQRQWLKKGWPGAHAPFMDCTIHYHALPHAFVLLSGGWCQVSVELDWDTVMVRVGLGCGY